MKHLHIHSDCHYFAGCERLLPLIWTSEEIQSNFRISLSYRTSESYESSLCEFGLMLKDRIPIFKSFSIGRNSPSSSTTELTSFTNLIQLLNKCCEILCLYPLFIYETLKLCTLFRRNRPDILHINNGGYPGSRSSRAAAVAGRICRVPKILMVVNNIAVPYSSLSRILDFPIDFLVRRCVNLFVTASNTASVALGRVLNLQPGQRRVISNAVDEVRIAEAKLSIRQEIKCETSQVVIGVIANLERRKGHAILLEALSLCVSKNPALLQQIQVWLIGDGPLLHELRTMSQDHGISEAVKFLGYRKDYIRLMSAMDIVVLPSISHEDSPLSSIQAMSLGIPLVVSNLAGLSSQVENNNNGFLVPVADSLALSAALTKLIGDEHLRHTMGLAGYLRFRSNHSVPQFLNAYHKLYTETSR